MIVAHIMGIPVEESVLYAPAGAATVTVVAILGRARLYHLLVRLTRRR